MSRSLKNKELEELRQIAEKRLDALASKKMPLDEDISSDIKNLLYELRIYQEELFIQNEELKSTELKLKSSNKEYLDLYHNAPFGYVKLNKEGIILNINQTFEETLQIPRESIIGKELYLCVEENQRDILFKHLNTVFKEKTTIQDRIDFLLKDSITRPMLIESRIIESSEHTNPVCLSAVIDIGIQVELENSLQKSNTEIKNLMRHQEVLTEDLHKKFSSLLHDEIGQLLTVILFDLNYINSHAQDEDKERVIQRSKSAIKHTKSVLKYIQDLAFELRPSTLSNLGIIEAVREALNQLKENSNILFEYITPKKVLGLSIDKEILMYRVIMEALTNAARHSKASHVCTIISKKDDEIEFSIEDDGIGITDEEAYSRDSLPIAILRERVDELKGKLFLQGKQDKGSILRVSFPV